MNSLLEPLVNPARLWSASEVAGKPSPIPSEPGAYAWYFREIPPSVPVEGCVTHGKFTLLYVGISPAKPPANGGTASRENLRRRIHRHYFRTARVSTLRMSLGCLLAGRLGIELRRVGSGNRLTFAAGEKTLSQWMAENAFVVWTLNPEPWTLEHSLIQTLVLPLNLRDNEHSPFRHTLSELRRTARSRALQLPIVSSGA